MLPLLSEDTFQDLRARRQSLPGDPAHVFVPVAQDNPQLLFIGQATSGAMLDGTYTDVAQESYELLEKYTLHPGRSGFWQALTTIIKQCGLIASPSGTRPIVGWSNLCKIGDTQANPSAQSIRDQADLCIRALREELRAAKPTITVLLTGHFAQDEILYPVFGNEGWRNNVPAEDRIAVKDHPDYGVVLWSYHPRSRHGIEYQDQLLSFVAGFAAGRLL
jgi:hypothetical protein